MFIFFLSSYLFFLKQVCNNSFYTPYVNPFCISSVFYPLTCLFTLLMLSLDESNLYTYIYLHKIWDSPLHLSCYFSHHTYCTAVVVVLNSDLELILIKLDFWLLENVALTEVCKQWEAYSFSKCQPLFWV